MKTNFLIILFITTGLYANNSIQDKIDEYCKLQSSVYTSERLKKHEFNSCIEKTLSKNLSLNEIEKMIKNDNSDEIKEKIAYRKRVGIQKKVPKKKIKQDTTGFNLNENDCYTIGLAYGACATRSKYGKQCEKGTDFIMPHRCRGKTTTKDGIRSGVALQTLLITK